MAWPLPRRNQHGVEPNHFRLKRQAGQEHPPRTGNPGRLRLGNRLQRFIQTGARLDLNKSQGPTTRNDQVNLSTRRR